MDFKTRVEEILKDPNPKKTYEVMVDMLVSLHKEEMVDNHVKKVLKSFDDRLRDEIYGPDLVAEAKAEAKKEIIEKLQNLIPGDLDVWIVGNSMGWSIWNGIHDHCKGEELIYATEDEGTFDDLINELGKGAK